MYFLKRIFFNIKKKKKVYLLNYEKNEELIFNELKNEKFLALDTEFEWRNTYFPRLSLIQISTKKKIFLLDCLNLRKAKILEEVLNKCELLIFHAVRSDTTVLSSSLNIKVNRVFDIQIAENVLTKEGSKNYGSIVNKYFPIKLKKTETNSNWLKRPFTKKQIDYAADDVEYLIEIHDKQKKLLKDKYKNVLISSSQEANLGNQELHVSRLNKFSSSNKLEKDLFMWRENQAKIKNVPPSHIIDNKKMKFLLNTLIKNKKFDKVADLLKSRDLAKNIFSSLDI